MKKDLEQTLERSIQETGSKKLEEAKEMRRIIKVYIPVDCEEPEIFNCKEDAEKEIESLSLMQPENIYQIEEIE